MQGGTQDRQDYLDLSPGHFQSSRTKTEVAQMAEQKKKNEGVQIGLTPDQAEAVLKRLREHPQVELGTLRNLVLYLDDRLRKLEHQEK